jgi:hypothetical protein
MTSTHSYGHNISANKIGSIILGLARRKELYVARLLVGIICPPP